MYEVKRPYFTDKLRLQTYKVQLDGLSLYFTEKYLQIGMHV